MTHLNWFQNFMVWLGHIDLDDANVKFKVNQALKDHGRKMRAIGVEEGRMEKAACKGCALWQADRRRLTGAYDQPLPTTDGKIAAHQPELPAWFKRRNPHLITTKLLPIAERPEGFLL